MYIIFRLVAIIINFLGILLHPIVALRAKVHSKKLPPNTDELLNIPAIELAAKIRNQELKSEVIVKAYIQRIKDVNYYINAALVDRFVDAIKDAKNADEICSKTPPAEILSKYPLLGIPFTVKESCALKGFQIAVGNVARVGIKALSDGEAVERLRAAGAIPLLTSANPEYCFSWETYSILYGCCRNPYDINRTPGGSSGGEGALNGAGASLFGVGSDFAGSIRVPSLFCGVFGHKPTGGLVSIKNHFPISSDLKYPYYLQIGPMTRFARDLPILLQIMAGENANKLNLNKNVYTKDIKIFYVEDVGFSFTHSPINSDIKTSILKAVDHFKRNGLSTQRANFLDLDEQMEIVSATYLDIEDVPDMLVNPDNPKKRDNLFIEILKHVFTAPKYSFPSLFFLLIQSSNALMTENMKNEYIEKGNKLKKQMLDMLGDNGVLFYPTFHCPALYHKTSVTNLGGVPYCSLFNIFGFPATHVPMGLGKNKLPIGFQVIAAPYQDKLCLTIAGELEAAFGGWVPPS